MKRIITTFMFAAVLVLTACGNKTETVPPTVRAEQTQEVQQTQEAQVAEVDTQAVYQSLEGYYQDSVSQRARMYVWQTESGLGIRVNWASSAFEDGEWDMTAVLTADSKLEYNDCAEYRLTYSDENEVKSEQVASNRQGFFTIKDGKLLWNGAADEGCRECVFEKLPEAAWPQSLEPEHTGVYWRTWSEEIAGTVVEMSSYIVLDEDRTGYWIAQDVGTLTWDESQLTLTVGATYNIALTQENGTVKLLVFEFQDDTGAWIPTVYDKIEKLPEKIENMLAES